MINIDNLFSLILLKQTQKLFVALPTLQNLLYFLFEIYEAQEGINLAISAYTSGCILSRIDLDKNRIKRKEGNHPFMKVNVIFDCNTI